MLQLGGEGEAEIIHSMASETDIIYSHIPSTNHTHANGHKSNILLINSSAVREGRK
jgi:hypothetical protein